MAPVKRLEAAPAPFSEEAVGLDDPMDFTDFEAELKGLAEINRQLLGELRPEAASEELPAEMPIDDPAGNSEEVELLRQENAGLRLRVQELEALVSGNSEELWQERQLEYEALLEEKSEVIRSLHQQIEDMQDSVNLGSAPQASSLAIGASSTRVGQAEEILRLKRELEEQRKQLEQDEVEMMAQMRQMELAMARERAEMARQKQEMSRLQADLTREIEQSSRDPDLRERLNTLRRRSDPKPAAAAEKAPEAASAKKDQPSSGFLRRIFG